MLTNHARGSHYCMAAEFQQQHVQPDRQTIRPTCAAICGLWNVIISLALWNLTPKNNILWHGVKFRELWTIVGPTHNSGRSYVSGKLHIHNSSGPRRLPCRLPPNTSNQYRGAILLSIELAHFLEEEGPVYCFLLRQNFQSIQLISGFYYMTLIYLVMCDREAWKRQATLLYTKQKFTKIGVITTRTSTNKGNRSA